MAEDKKCAHPSCNCKAGKDSKYCSPYCEAAGITVEIQLQLWSRGVFESLGPAASVGANAELSHASLLSSGKRKPERRTLIGF